MTDNLAEQGFTWLDERVADLMDPERVKFGRLYLADRDDLARAIAALTWCTPPQDGVLRLPFSPGMVLREAAAQYGFVQVQAVAPSGWVWMTEFDETRHALSLYGLQGRNRDGLTIRTWIVDEGTQFGAVAVTFVRTPDPLDGLTRHNCNH